METGRWLITIIARKKFVTNYVSLTSCCLESLAAAHVSKVEMDGTQYL